MISLKDIGGSALGVLAAFSVLSIPVIGKVGALQKIFAMSILGITLIVLWGKNYF